MFKFYSLLSPTGKPDPAALALAEGVEHSWSRQEGMLTLEVVGLDVSPFFLCSDGSSLFLYHPHKIYRVSLPSAPDQRFILSAWDSNKEELGAGLARIPAPGRWCKRSGEVVDLLSLDRELFPEVDPGVRALPSFTVGVGANNVCILFPYGLLDLLESVEGPLHWVAKPINAGSVSLSAQGKTQRFYGTGAADNFSAMVKKHSHVVVFDSTTERPVSLTAV
jgi:hypothetical protein